ncbi:putative signal peptidase complex subunit 2 [Taenia crassiceps]|uniref:Signal peptidase complex subunit 2 n=1 Tax=Taenia crassiceps TaxID=6207 RepID=A0ABR4QS00_9CEST
MKSHYGLRENFRLIDTRLMLCTASVLFTVIALVYDYLCPYPESRHVLIVCIVSYFINTSILSWHAYFVEGNIFFVGIQPDKAGLDPPNKWTFASQIKNPDYRLTLNYLDGTTNKQSTVEAVKTINCFFDEKGKLCSAQLESFILSVCKDNSQTIGLDMNQLKILEIKRRRYEDRQQRALANAAARSPVERPILYILDKQNRLLHQEFNNHRNAEGTHRNKVDRISLTLLPSGHKASKLIYNDALPHNETPALQSSKLPKLPKPPAAHSQDIKSTAAVASQSPRLMDSEKRDRVIFQAVEIISEWLAAEPCFIDPEVTYGDKNKRFLDTVLQRLHTFKTMISWEVMKMLQNANNACRETSHSPIMNRLPLQQSALRTPTSCSKTDSITIAPRRTPISGELTSPARNRCTSRQVPFHIDLLPQIGPTTVAEVPRGVLNAVLYHPCQYKLRAGKTPPDLFEGGGGRSDDGNLDTCRWRRPSRRQLRLEVDVEGDFDNLLTSGALRHPIWDTPDECKTYYSNILMLE